MKKVIKKLPGLMATLTVILFYTSCQKDVVNKNAKTGLQESTKSEGANGHLQQAKTFSSEGVIKWINMQLEIGRAHV